MGAGAIGWTAWAMTRPKCSPMEAPEHRYILEPYAGPGSRHTCPQCGRAGAFVRYIDAATGEPLADNVGRCNREDSCGYHYKPGQYFKDHPGQGLPYQPPKRTKTRPIVREWKPAPPLESYTIPQNTLEALYRSEAKEEAGRMASRKLWPVSRVLWGANRADQCARIIEGSAFRSSPGATALAAFLSGLLGPAAFQETATKYRLGSWRGAAVFWYIDKAGRIRTGKAMRYLTNGHRDKERNPFYIHGVLASQGMLPVGWKLRRCLFGEHLLAADPAAPVALVESEKTALIGAALCPGPVWLAAGGKQYLNADCCAALKGRCVVAYPDLQAFEEWQRKLAEIAGQVGFVVDVSDLLERTATDADRAAGLDIADYLIQANTTAQAQARASISKQ